MSDALADDYRRHEALLVALTTPDEAIRRVDLALLRERLTAAGWRGIWLPGEGEAWLRVGCEGVRMPDGDHRRPRDPEAVTRVGHAVAQLAATLQRHPHLLLADLVLASELGRR